MGYDVFETLAKLQKALPKAEVSVTIKEAMFGSVELTLTADNKEIKLITTYRGMVYQGSFNSILEKAIVSLKYAED